MYNSNNINNSFSEMGLKNLQNNKVPSHSFEELLLNILTPESSSLEGHVDKPEDVKRMMSKSSSFEMMVDSVINSQTMETAPNLKTTSENNMTFDQLMNVIFTPELCAPFNNTPESQKMKQVEHKQQMKKSFGCVSNENKDPQENFDVILSQALSSSSECYEETDLTENLSVTKTFAEISTQTCFEESVAVSEQNNVSYNNSIFTCPTVSFIPQLSHLPSLSELPDRKGMAITNNCLVANLENEEAHILSTLKQDITILPDGRKIFNKISSIGTLKWLDSATTSLRNLGKIDRRKETVITESENSCDIYEDYVGKLYVKREVKNDVKICKLVETPSSNPEDEMLLSFLNKKEDSLTKSIEHICRNPDFLPKPCQVLRKIDKSKIQMKIHNIVAKLYEVFESGMVPVLCYKKFDFRLSSRPLKRLNVRSRKFRNKFCRLLYILGKIHALIESNTISTNREIFYQVKSIFKRQDTCRVIVQEVSTLLGIGSWHFNIIAHSGLVHGNLTLIWKSGNILHCKAPATLIPDNLEDLAEIQTTASFILVVEKESIFCQLLEEDLMNKLARPFIMITGKGSPNFSTRVFLKKLSTFLSLPVFILVDPDVYGIKIMCTYRFGCINSWHLSDELTVPHARWLGVYPSEIAKYGLEHQKLNQRDKSLIKSMLKYPFVMAREKLSFEISTLLTSNKKSSIESLIKFNNFLSHSYLPSKFCNQDFI